jgi:midasin
VQVICGDISRAEVSIKSVEVALEKYKNGSVIGVAATPQDVDFLEKIRNNMVMLYQKWRAIFVWQDGPLVEAMRAGNIVLVDEISLADDSVLERMNSVLETDRKLVSKATLPSCSSFSHSLSFSSFLHVGFHFLRRVFISV